MTSCSPFKQTSRDVCQAEKILEETRVMSQAGSDPQLPFSPVSAESAGLSLLRGNPEDVESEMAVSPPAEDATTSESQSVRSAISSESNSLGSPPLFTISPPPDDHDHNDLLDDQEVVVFTSLHGSGRRFSDVTDDLQVSRASHGPRRHSDSGLGKSRSPTRSSPRRYSPNPYSRRRTHSGSSATSEDFADVSLSPGRRSSLTVTPQNGYVTAEEYLTPDEEYLEVTVTRSDEEHGSCHADVEVAFSAALTMDTDSCDVEMAEDKHGASADDSVPAASEETDQQRVMGAAPTPQGSTLGPRPFAHLNASPDVANTSTEFTGTTDALPTNVEHTQHRDLTQPSLEQSSKDIADSYKVTEDPFSSHPCDVSLLTDDSSDDDVSIGDSDREITAEGEQGLPLQFASCVTCDGVSGSDSVAYKSNLYTCFHSCQAASKHACSAECVRVLQGTPDSSCCGFGSAANTVSSPVSCWHAADNSSPSFHQPHSQPSVTGSKVSEKEHRVVGTNLPDLSAQKCSAEVSAQSAAGTFVSQGNAPDVASSLSSSSSFQDSSGLSSDACSRCACGGHNRICDSQSFTKIPCVHLAFPHCVNAILLLPSRLNPYNPALPTPPVILTPHSSYEKSVLCCSDLLHQGHLETKNVHAMEAFQGKLPSHGHPLSPDETCSASCSYAADSCCTAGLSSGVSAHSETQRENDSFSVTSTNIESCQNTTRAVSTLPQCPDPDCSKSEAEDSVRSQQEVLQQQADHGSKSGWWPRHHQYHHHNQHQHHHHHHDSPRRHPSPVHYHRHHHDQRTFHDSHDFAHHHSTHMHYHHHHHHHHKHHHSVPYPRQQHDASDFRQGSSSSMDTSKSSTNTCSSHITTSGGSAKEPPRTGENGPAPVTPAAGPGGPGQSSPGGNSRAALLGHLRRVVERRLSSSEDPASDAAGKE